VQKLTLQYWKSGVTIQEEMDSVVIQCGDKIDDRNSIYANCEDDKMSYRAMKLSGGEMKLFFCAVLVTFNVNFIFSCFMAV
jgi:hypothetical protein